MGRNLSLPMETLDHFCKFGRNSYFRGISNALLRVYTVLTKKVTQRDGINTDAEKGKNSFRISQQSCPYLLWEFLSSGLKYNAKECIEWSFTMILCRWRMPAQPVSMAWPRVTLSERLPSEAHKSALVPCCLQRNVTLSAFLEPTATRGRIFSSFPSLGASISKILFYNSWKINLLFIPTRPELLK